MKRRDAEQITQAKRVRLNGDRSSVAIASEGKAAGLYRPPTADELNHLKEAETLFKSNLFRMQITELLAETGIKEKRVKLIEPVIHSIRDVITNIPVLHDIELSDAPSNLMFDGDVHIPLMWKSLVLKGSMSLSPPSSVRVIGSFLLRTQCKPNINVDLAVEIPRTCVHEKDYMNHLYFAKRAVYLGYLASHLQQRSEVVRSASYVIVDGDRLRPVLQLELAGKVGKVCNIRIWPALSDGVFKLNKLGPTRNNVRPGKFCLTEHSFGNGWMPATPHYNSSVLMDMSFDRHLRLLYEACSDCLAMRDAILLLKVWMQQRGLSQGLSGFSGFIVSMLTAHLLRCKKLNHLMSSYQILRVVMKFLASTDWSVSGISMVDTAENDKLPLLDDFQQVFEVVFVDTSGFLNLCSGLTKLTYYNVRNEAQVALQLLDSSAVDGFEALFMMQVKFSMKFEQLFYVPVSAFLSLGKSEDTLSFVIDYGGDWLNAAIRYISSLLVKGLSNRIELLACKLHVPTQWSVTEKCPADTSGFVTFGLVLNSDHAFSLLDKGPAADDQKAGDFRLFWGKKAELRRFQDGSITEAVIWPCDSQAEKRLICSRIVKYLLEKYASIDSLTVMYVADQLDCLLVPHRSSFEHSQKGTGEEKSVSVLKAYESLTKDMRRLTDLPLGIHSIQGTSPAFRETEVFPPIPCGFFGHGVGLSERTLSLGKVMVPAQSRNKGIPSWMQPLKVVCHLEGSGKWPDDITALQKIKTAFYLKLAELLQKKCRLTAIPTEQCAFVRKLGYVFQLCVATDRETLLLRSIIPSLSGLTREERVAQAEKLELENVHLPLLTSTLRGLEMQHPSFSLTARLAKRWISSQLLAQDISDECVELLVAYLYLSPSPYQAPGSSLCGFQRFLSLLCHHDWTSNALMVNLNSEFTNEDYQAISAVFSSQRSHLPAMFISTPRNKEKSIWTQDGPSVKILTRLVILAKESLDFLEKQLTDCANIEVDFKTIFRPSLEDYDVVIWLKSEFLPRIGCSVDEVNGTSSKSKSGLAQKDCLPVTGFNPATSYLMDLKNEYEDVALFFHDVYGGQFIAVVWKPSTLQQEPFKLGCAGGRVPIKKCGKKKQQMKTLTSLNTDAIIEDFRIMGKGLVCSVDVLKSKTAMVSTVPL
ncbi:nucleolar protein 6-like isoform X2 [Corticium candelabrum]|uniref:nucleolar protein 6-like isoform X2 n=1 Tax=Corticium candelabrum TaxID=121492 RepID=UPI002E26A0F9|nr:nucleolar protein 6-like isoform X2 [Corticium candelabrum]